MPRTTAGGCEATIALAPRNPRTMRPSSSDVRTDTRTACTPPSSSTQCARAAVNEQQSWPTGRIENVMHDFQTHLFRPVVAAMIVLLASPLMAQAPSGQPSTRASVLDQAREALTSQSVPPERSTIERGLFWYDNQHVLDKILGGWKGIRIGGGD